MTKKLKATQSDDLLAQIRKAPLDDELRKVYADLLEQRGDVARAQLIHVQLRRAALPAWDPQVIALELQERALLAANGAAWRAQLPELHGVTWGSFTRGFVGKVAFDSVDAFEEHRDDCLAATPVTSIAIRWPEAEKPKKLAAIDGLDELSVFGTLLRPDDLKWLASSPIVSTIRSLNLIDSELRSGLPKLLKSPHLARLTALRMPLHLAGNAGVAKLAATELPALTTLDLSTGIDEGDYEGNYGGGRRSASTLGMKGILALAQSAGFARITSLDVSGAKLGRDGLTGLLASPYSKHLKSLVVRAIADAEWDTDDSLAAFGTGPAGELDELDLGKNDLDDDGAAALVNHRALQQLKVLRLDLVKSRSFNRIAQAPWIDSLRVLTCGESALELIVPRKPKQLHTLRVIAEGSSAHGVAKKLTTAMLPALQYLDLSASRITDPSLRVLGACTTMPKLVAVKLAATPASLAAFTPEGAAEFAASPLGKRLEALHTGIATSDRLPPSAPIEFGDGEYDGPYRYL